MSSSKPPALATWLLEHLALGGNREALAGDLLEQFNQRRSSAWYWRQVLAAVALGLWKEWRIVWVAIAFTLVWVGVIYPGRIWMFVQVVRVLNRGTLDWVIRLPWPVSLVGPVGFFTAVNWLPLPASLGIYLGAMRSFSLRRFLRGLLAGLFALPAIVVADLLLLSALWNHVPSFVGYGVASLPLFLALLLSMWVALPHGERTRGARVPI